MRPMYEALHSYSGIPEKLGDIRFRSCEAEVDDLLRSGIFVDLFSLLRQSLLIGATDYSLKSIEKLYCEQRGARITTAADSMAEYHRWLEQRDGNDCQTSA